MARRPSIWRGLDSALDSTQRRWIVVVGVVQVALQVAALVDLRRRSEAELNGSERVWVMLSSVNFVGPIAYFLAGRRRRGVGTAVGSSR
jgi:hypothetical protein